MGLLDDISGAGGSPWGASYPSPLNQPDPQALAVQYAAAGIDPSAMTQQSPFGPVPNMTPSPSAAPSGFGAGAAPFSFGGPGSMNDQPSQIASPLAAPAPTAAPAAPPSAPQPDRYVNVGNYQMPQFGNPPPMSMAGPAQPAPQPGGLRAGLNGFLSNLQAGPIGALIGGVGSAAGLQSPRAQLAAPQPSAAPSQPQNPTTLAAGPQLQNILPPRPNILWPRQS